MKLYDINIKDNKFSCIYLWVNSINNKKYVGQTQDFGRRMSKYKGNQYNRYMKFAVQKYGIENFDIYIIEKDIPLDKLNEREQYWIDYFQCCDHDKGYNIVDVVNSPRLYGELNGMYGKKHSKEWRKNHSEWLKNKWANDKEYREFWKNRISGENNYFYDKHFVGKLNPRARAVRCVETNKTYDTILEASKDIGISRQNISHVLNGKQKTAGGYHWEYL